MRRTRRRQARAIKVAERRAVTAVGKEVANEIQDVIARLTGASRGQVRRVMRRVAPRPGTSNPVYKVSIRRGLPLKAIGKAKRRFTPARRGSKVGTLEVVELDGTRVTFHGVRREGKGRGVRYILPKTARYRERAAGGLRVRVDSTRAIALIRRGIPRRLRREVKRQYRLAARR